MSTIDTIVTYICTCVHMYVCSYLSGCRVAASRASWRHKLHYFGSSRAARQQQDAVDSCGRRLIASKHPMQESGDIGGNCGEPWSASLRPDKARLLAESEWRFGVLGTRHM